jgi:hypothetical protein
MMFIRAASGIGLGATTANILYRYLDSVQGLDGFSRHTNAQHQQHFISGMHEPYIPSALKDDTVLKKAEFFKVRYAPIS